MEQYAYQQVQDVVVIETNAAATIDVSGGNLFVAGLQEPYIPWRKIIKRTRQAYAAGVAHKLLLTITAFTAGLTYEFALYGAGPNGEKFNTVISINSTGLANLAALVAKIVAVVNAHPFLSTIMSATSPGAGMVSFNMTTAGHAFFGQKGLGFLPADAFSISQQAIQEQGTVAQVQDILDSLQNTTVLGDTAYTVWTITYSTPVVEELTGHSGEAVKTVMVIFGDNNGPTNEALMVDAFNGGGAGPSFTPAKYLAIA